jgi:hypothetical protein
MRSRTKIGVAALASVSLLGTGAFAQNVAEGGRRFTVTLSGAAEAPGPGDPDGSGTVTITLNHGQQRVCYDFELTNVENVTAAHIHEAPIGQPGPVVVPLFSGGLDEEGCVENVSRGLIKEIIKTPGDYYVNVHSTNFPAGAVRGQLTK